MRIAATRHRPEIVDVVGTEKIHRLNPWGFNLSAVAIAACDVVAVAIAKISAAAKASGSGLRRQGNNTLFGCSVRCCYDNKARLSPTALVISVAQLQFVLISNCRSS